MIKMIGFGALVLVSTAMIPYICGTLYVTYRLSGVANRSLVHPYVPELSVPLLSDVAV